MKLHDEDFPTISLFITSYRDLNIMLVILHLIEEVPNFKAFIKPFILKGVDHFYMCNNAILAMQIKVLYTSLNWAQRMKYSFGTKMNMANMCYQIEKPKPCTSNSMMNGLEIIMGLSRFIEY